VGAGLQRFIKRWLPQNHLVHPLLWFRLPLESSDSHLASHLAPTLTFGGFRGLESLSYQIKTSLTRSSFGLARHFRGFYPCLLSGCPYSVDTQYEIVYHQYLTPMQHKAAMNRRFRHIAEAI